MRTIIKSARQLRSHMTDVEQVLWQRLRMRQMNGLKFRRQHPCGQYIIDFACLENKLGIEVDGGQHDSNVEKDNLRTQWLASHGWTILRFWNHEVLKEIEAVLAEVNQYCSICANPAPKVKIE